MPDIEINSAEHADSVPVRKSAESLNDHSTNKLQPPMEKQTLKKAMERKVKKKPPTRTGERPYNTPEAPYQAQTEPMKQRRQGNTDNTFKEKTLFNISKMTSNAA